MYQFLCAYTGSALSEFFMLVRELPSFLMLDDLSRHGMAYREIYLLLRRPPGREAYPGEIFFVHSRLLERSAKLSANAFPVIERLAGDVSAYIIHREIYLPSINTSHIIKTSITILPSMLAINKSRDLYQLISPLMLLALLMVKYFYP